MKTSFYSLPSFLRKFKNGQEEFQYLSFVIVSTIIKIS
ncbi:hypothetical protein SSUA7_1657 [Streptococcus suis A7]|uniref:Uncharacterized protein n=1 Tax=Streptococcus suis (strain GZ1) TaxID=423211 RepID=D5AJU4_STRGZ|nr:hypothetical protein SSGZ1_1653 [Streptococcus suis GZ1]ADV70853.1 hypothetical protein SSUJS14_1795 [Streptococcus suis JS14]AER15951.1 hypothetical protein SSU12_1774 [Streptococcus suis SS12]AER44975.1 hypothetical protein SSUA7_1657 [Streptococcus suis A7]